MRKQVDGKTITLGDMINRGVWALAREVFDQEAVANVGQGPGEPKRRGFELILFSPGDVGATVRFRW